MNCSSELQTRGHKVEASAEVVDSEGRAGSAVGAPEEASVVEAAGAR